MNPRNVGRKDSITRKLANEFIALAPPALKYEVVEIGALALYNQDLEDHAAAPPEPWVRFRQRVAQSEGVLFFTPEYNRSVPAALKNAIDVGSRPYGKSVWEGKPGAIVSISPGAIGGFGANHHLRQSMVFLGVPIMAAPEAYIGNALGLFDGDGRLNNDSTRNFLTTFGAAYAQWVEANGRK
ncbi:NADPH-dependent FMN reductase [Deltaproteobacteria bacterium]|nr:NADPH-dependent FMN reductase [Deltaproteobacteria bacterium]